ncbi:MAG: 16S rRNA (guanine(527)-N(7))-methyltransferase RsmG [Mucinivorans sp.]
MDQILKYFPSLTPAQCAQFELLQGLYDDWNAKINVVSRADLSNLYQRHVLHSLALARGGWIARGAKVLDLGCGGGFPVIPLAILMPEVSFTAVDSVAKKIKVAQGVAQALGLQNIEFSVCRAESLPGQWDWVISRAVAPLGSLLEWSRGRYTKGLLTLKGGDLDAEIEASGAAVSVFEIGKWFDEEFFSTKKVIFVEKNLQNHK